MHLAPSAHFNKVNYINMFSQEYVLALVLVLGGVLKAFDIEIENSVIEGVITGVIAIWIAFRRFMKGDINILGAKL